VDIGSEKGEAVSEAEFGVRTGVRGHYSGNGETWDCVRMYK